MIARIKGLNEENDAGDHERAMRARNELVDAFRVERERGAEWRPKVDAVSVVEEVEALRAEVDCHRPPLNRSRDFLAEPGQGGSG